MLAWQRLKKAVVLLCHSCNFRVVNYYPENWNRCQHAATIKWFLSATGYVNGRSNSQGAIVGFWQDKMLKKKKKLVSISIKGIKGNESFLTCRTLRLVCLRWCVQIWHSLCLVDYEMLWLMMSLCVLKNTSLVILWSVHISTVSTKLVQAHLKMFVQAAVMMAKTFTCHRPFAKVLYKITGGNGFCSCSNKQLLWPLCIECAMCCCNRRNLSA